MTENEETQETEIREIQPGRRVTRSMTRINITTNNDIRENTRVTRSMSRENKALPPNINDNFEFAMVGGTNESYINPRNFEEALNHKKNMKGLCGVLQSRKNFVICSSTICERKLRKKKFQVIEEF